MRREEESLRESKEGTRPRRRGMMKSSFMLYILCMKISDPESRCYCEEREILDSRLACASLHSLWIQIAPGLRGLYPRYAAYIVLSSLERGRKKIEGTLRTRAEYAKDAKGIKKGE